MKLLDVDCYRFDVLCVWLSAGDVNETGSRSARNALLQYAKDKQSCKNRIAYPCNNIFKVLTTKRAEASCSNAEVNCHVVKARRL